MDITKTILKRATIQGLADSLIYGTAIESKRQEKQVDYDERLEKAYAEYEKNLKLYTEKSISELIDSANDMASEVAEVYTAIGLQAGILIVCDLIQITRNFNLSVLSIFYPIILTYNLRIRYKICRVQLNNL